MKITSQNITSLVRWLRLACCASFALALTGCFGVVGGGYGYYGGPGYFDDYGPDVTIFGGYHGGHWAHDYARRGFTSRSAIGGHFSHGGFHH